jgi:hypothetical protein
MTSIGGLTVPGIRLGPSHHVGGLFQTPRERDRVLIPYFQTALRAGQACFIALDTADPGRILCALGSREELTEWTSTGQLVIKGAASATTSPDGMTVLQMQAIWDSTLAAAQDLRAHGPVRVGGEAAWWMTGTAADTLVQYESEMNGLLPAGVGMLCLYDLNHFRAEAVLDVLRTHPFMLVGGLVIDNPY